jgi:hypothetical protein
MPFQYKIFQQQKTVIVQAKGVIDLHSCIQAMKDVAGDKDFDPQYKVIVDLREMKYNPSTSDLFAIRDSLVSLIHNFKNDITIVTTKEALYLANLVCTLAKVHHVKMVAAVNNKELDSLEHEM